MSTELELSGQTLLVIGGSSGIGLETARRARTHGAHIIITARNADRLHRAGLELRAEIAAFDATDLDRLARFFEALSAPVDHVLVAGPATHSARLAEFDAELARRDVHAHLLLPLQVAWSAAPKIRPGGTLLFLGRTNGCRPAVGSSLTSGLAAALPAITKNLALELAPVRVNLITARFVDTPLSARVLEQTGIAALAVHLMTNAAVAGATFEVAGGRQFIDADRAHART